MVQAKTKAKEAEKDETVPVETEPVDQPVEEEPRPFWGDSPFTSEQLAALGSALDRSRVKQREGRGKTKFDYLETHDVVRTANEVFGYGRWGHRIVAQERIGEVAVQKERGGKATEGWHVAYRCVVEVTVNGCQPISGSGYGDGVEYGAAAQLTASELALKESESDALKRALKNFGDQFGLILYAKVDDQRRLERDQAADQAVERRIEGPPPVPVPTNWAEIEQLVVATDGLEGWEAFRTFASQAAEHLYGQPDYAQLTAEQKTIVGQKAAGAAVHLAELHPGLGFVGGDFIGLHRQAWAKVLDGEALLGPEVAKADPTDAETEAIADAAFAGVNASDAKDEKEGT